MNDWKTKSIDPELALHLSGKCDPKYCAECQSPDADAPAFQQESSGSEGERLCDEYPDCEKLCYGCPKNPKSKSQNRKAGVVGDSAERRAKAGTSDGGN